MPQPPINPPVEVREMLPGDLRFAARLHALALPHGLFPRLGEPFLRAYLRTFVQSRDAVALIAIRGEMRSGFVVGVVDERAHYRWVVRRRGLILCAVGFMAILRRPVVAVHFARTRLRRYAAGLARLARGSAPGVAVPAEGRPAVLAHIAVESADRGSGVGGQLASAFLEQVRERGGVQARLLTLSDGPAGRFYERLGRRHSETIDDGDGLRWTSYVIDL